MSSAFQPKSLDNWLNILDETLLPVLPTRAHKIGRLMKDRDVSLFDIAEVIDSDPVMRVHLVRECNRQHKETAAGTLSNTHHCVAMLGLDKVQLLLRQFKAAKGDPKEPRDFHYFQAISQSLHAAEQAASWAQYRNQSKPDQMFLAALMYGVPMWCLWRFAHKEMNIIDTLFQREQIPLQEAEHAVLGCTREDIANGLAQRWFFPDAIQSALKGDQLPGPRFLLKQVQAFQQNPQHKMPNRTADGKLVNTPALAIALSNTLAQESSRDWYSKPTQRCLSVISAYLAQPEDEINTLAKQTALHAAQRWRFPGIQSPANGLLWPLQPRKKRRIKKAQLALAVAKLSGQTTQPQTQPPSAPEPRQPAQAQSAKSIGFHSENLPEGLDHNSIKGAPKPSMIPTAPVARFTGFKSLDKRNEFESGLRKLIQQPDYFSDEFETIRHLVELLHGCSLLSRVIVALFDKKNHQVKSYFALGCEETPALENFKENLQPVNLFTKLLAQPAGVWISPDRKSQAAGLIPGNFKQASQSDEFFLMSVFNHRGAYGLFYADKGPHCPEGLSEIEYKIFKAACSTGSKHLMIRAKRAAAKHSKR